MASTVFFWVSIVVKFEPTQFLILSARKFTMPKKSLILITSTVTPLKLTITTKLHQRGSYATLRGSVYYKNRPNYWQNILNRRSQNWEPLEANNIPKNFSTVRKWRDIEEYYLRNITICIVQGVVRMQFNCDGTQTIDAHNFKHFLK